jgi:hypothetical protein
LSLTGSDNFAEKGIEAIKTHALSATVEDHTG